MLICSNNVWLGKFWQIRQIICGSLTKKIYSFIKSFFIKNFLLGNSPNINPAKTSLLWGILINQSLVYFAKQIVIHFRGLGISFKPESLPKIITTYTCNSTQIHVTQHKIIIFMVFHFIP